MLTDVCLALMGFLEGSRIPLKSTYPTQLSDDHEKPHKMPFPGHSQALEVLLIPVMNTLEKPAVNKGDHLNQINAAQEHSTGTHFTQKMLSTLSQAP